MCLPPISYLRVCNPRLAIRKVLLWLPLYSDFRWWESCRRQSLCFHADVLKTAKKEGWALWRCLVWNSRYAVGKSWSHTCDVRFWACQTQTTSSLQHQAPAKEQVPHSRLKHKFPFPWFFVSFVNLFSISNQISFLPSFKTDSPWFYSQEKKKKKK